MSPSASVRSVMSVLKTGAWLALVDRPGEGVGVGQSVPSLTVTIDVVRARAERATSVPLMTPVLALIDDAVGQAGGAVGERVEVGIGGVGVEADTVSPSASVWSVKSVLKTGAWLVSVDGPGEGVGVGVGAVGDGEDDGVGAGAGEARACH